MEARLETPPLEVIGHEHPDTIRNQELARLRVSPEVEVIGRMLANIERKRLGFASVLRLENLEPEETQHFREAAVLAIRMLDREQQDEAIYAAAKMYAIRTYGCGLDGMSDHKKGFCVWVARAVCNIFRHTMSGNEPLSGAEARGWKSLEKKMQRGDDFKQANWQP